jgi:hypothetical protein
MFFQSRTLARLCFCLLLGSLPLSAESDAPEVSLTGSLSAHAIHQDESLQFTLTVKNRADAKTNPNTILRNLTLQGLPAGYSFDREKPICVLPLALPQTQSCDTVTAFDAQNRMFRASLSPGQSVTVQGYLKPNPDSSHAAAPLTVVVAWMVDGGMASSQSANLGENEVLSTWQTVQSWLSDLIKLAFIPAILALIGFGLNYLNREHDERFAKENRAHDESFTTANRTHDEKFAREQQERQIQQHVHEQEQALRSETWKQMLPLSHTYGAKFYLPLSLAAQNLAGELKDPIEKPMLAFFYLLLCSMKMKATRNEIGGFYFKDLRGERLASNCWEIQRITSLGKPDDDFYKAVHAAIDNFDNDLDSYETFESKFLDTSTNPATILDDAVAKAWKLFEKWSEDKDKVKKTSQYLTGFYSVLDYESNRPYEFWYNPNDSPARLEIKEDTENLLKEVLEKAKYTPEQIKSYFSTVVRPG